VSAVIRADRVSSEDVPGVVAALRGQTLGGLEEVLWDPARRTARLVDGPPGGWQIAPGTDLASTLLGKFVVAATPALASVPATYLEANAMALEGEGLDFTLNAFGSSAEAEEALAAGRVPTDPGGTALVVARAECLDDDLVFSTDRIPSRGGTGHVAGRLLMHPSQAGMLGPSGWTGTLASSRWRLSPSDRRVVAQEVGTAGAIAHVLRPLDTVLPVEPIRGTSPRVLVVFPFIAVGGAERLTLDVLTRLRPCHEFVVVALEPCDPSLGSMVTEYRALTPHVYVLPDLLPVALNFSAVSYLIRRYAVETLFVANGSNWIYDAASALRDQFPGLHMVNQVYDHAVGWIERCDATIARVFDRHVAPNKRIVEAFRRRGVDDSRIDLIYHGIEVRAFDPAGFAEDRVAALRERFGLPPNRPVVVFPARLHPQKRPGDFLALAQRFRPEEASFLMVGDGPLAEEMDRRVRALGLDHFFRLPFHKPFDEILGVSDVVVVPSEYEALPLVLLMAQAMGRPVVATDVGAIREVIELTGGGVVVDRPGDVDALERGVRSLIGTSLDRETIRSRLQARFDIEVVARQYGDALARR
jgi:glycosyltransferase involved in cell wall biosynthesis